MKSAEANGVSRPCQIPLRFVLTAASARTGAAYSPDLTAADIRFVAEFTRWTSRSGHRTGERDAIARRTVCIGVRPYGARMSRT